MDELTNEQMIKRSDEIIAYGLESYRQCMMEENYKDAELCVAHIRGVGYIKDIYELEIELEAAHKRIKDFELISNFLLKKLIDLDPEIFS